MSETYKQLKNELLDQSTYTLNEVDYRLDMVMFYAARGAAAWDVARDAAREAVWSAAEGARDEMRKRQEAKLRRICEEG